MGKYFGTDGFRGEANRTLTVEHAFKIGRFIGWYYGQQKEEKCRVVIGKDTRRSSYMFEYSLVAGLTASGADVYLLHVTTTPSVSYVARTENFDCGIMISASHNPYYDNGIKLLNGDGEKMDEETILKIEAYLDGEIGEIPYAADITVGCASKEKGAVSRQQCAASCIGCRLCEKNCPSDAIHVVDNVAVIDYSKCTSCGICVSKCPRKVLTNIHDDGRVAPVA